MFQLATSALDIIWDSLELRRSVTRPKGRGLSPQPVAVRILFSPTRCVIGNSPADGAETDPEGFKEEIAFSPVEQEKLMRKFKFGKTSLAAFVLVALVAGCGREQARSPLSPAVIATSPVNGATAVLLNTTVTATFSSVMAPATINTSTFTLTGPGGPL